MSMFARFILLLAKKKVSKCASLTSSLFLKTWIRIFWEGDVLKLEPTGLTFCVGSGDAFADRCVGSGVDRLATVVRVRLMMGVALMYAEQIRLALGFPEHCRRGLRENSPPVDRWVRRAAGSRARAEVQRPVLGLVALHAAVCRGTSADTQMKGGIQWANREPRVTRTRRRRREGRSRTRGAGGRGQAALHRDWRLCRRI